MKHFALFLVLAFYFSISDQAKNKNNSISDARNNIPQYYAPSASSVEMNSINTYPKGKNTSGATKTNGCVHGNAIEEIRNEEYNISYSEDLKSYQSPNRANNIRFIYHTDGFTARTREDKIPVFDVNDRSVDGEEMKDKSISEWSIRFKTLSLKHESDGKASSTVSEEGKDNSFKFTGTNVRVDKNKASVEDDNIRIDYSNTEKGMRQDFIIKNRPYGDGKLKLELSAETDLKIIVEKDALKFKDEAGKEKMVYSSLRVWDANGKVLAACFEANYEIQNINYGLKTSNSNYKVKNQESEIEYASTKSDFSNPRSFSIVVNDEGATYPVTIDPISTSADWIGESNMEDAAYGYSVSTAGDVNADGFSDVIIGAFLYDNGQINEGRVFVYYGSTSGLSTTPNWTAESDQMNAQFGYSVSCAGDVNGDGYSDVIIGANIYDNDQADEGRAFLYYGSATGLSSSPNWTTESNQGGSQFGWSVSTAGDVNNDGFSDVIVGAPLYDNDETDEGRSYIYYGSLLGLSTTANWVTESNQGTSLFGYSVSTAGDVNGDGYSDVVVGANRYDTPIFDEGRAFVYYGSATGPSLTPSWTSESYPLAFFGYYGNSVSTAGDVNADGYSDVIVGAYSHDGGQPDEGKVFVYHGSVSGLSPIPNWTAESDQPYARYGNSVATAGDVNSDGYSDVIVGASEYDNGEPNEGSAFVYYGSPTGLLSTDNWLVESNQANALFGVSVSTAGDVNGDGFQDVIVGGYLYDNGEVNEGSAFVFHGSGLASDSLVLQLTVFIQGFYDSTTNSLMQDTLKVYLRSSSAPYDIVDSSKGLLNASGTGAFVFTNAVNEMDYYIQVNHRNSIETWSTLAKSFVNNFLVYDFSTGLEKAHGNNMVLIDTSPVRYGIYSGDVNQDGIINASDLSLTDNDVFNLIVGYVRTDLNGDNLVNQQDLNIVDYNVFNAVIAVRRK